MNGAKSRRERGFSVILTTLAITSTVLMTGLGFDVATVYLIRTRLQGAVDAAALTSARALAQSGNMTNAQTVGLEFLTANFPTGYFGAQILASMPLANDITIAMIDQNGNAGTAGSTAVAKLVTVNAGVSAPLYFLRMVGQKSVTIYASAQSKREGLLVMLVLDGSGSMANLIGGTPACTYAKNDAQAFLGYSQFDPDIDRMGLVTFGGNTYTVAPIANFQSPAGTLNTSSTVYTALNSFACAGNTNTVEGLQATYTAMQTFYGGSGFAANRADVLVLMTDGAPNGFTADWRSQVQSGDQCAGPASSPTHIIGFIARETPDETGIYNVAVGTSTNMLGSGTLGPAPNNGHCAFNSNTYNWNGDFTSVPASDLYGDAMTGGSTYLNTTSTQVADVTSTNQEQQFRNLSSNAADGAATRLRTDSNLRITIETVALAGNSNGNIYDLLDATLLQRIANTPSSPIYNPSQPVGAYFYAQDATYLGGEFAAVAAEISARLSK
jgi:Mg-chelatase subunit ChlD